MRFTDESALVETGTGLTCSIFGAYFRQVGVRLGVAALHEQTAEGEGTEDKQPFAGAELA
jgi:hypothetical protein